MRAVLDTVVIVRALLNKQNRCGRIIFNHPDRFVHVTSQPILTEMLDVIYRSTIQARLRDAGEPGPLDGALQFLSTAVVVAPKETLSVSRDPKDNKFFECAVAGQAGCIVSEDRDILDVSEFRGIKTLTCRQFLELLT